MQDRFSISLAGLTVEMHSQYPFARDFCQDYLSASASPDIVARASEEEIERDRQAVETVSFEYAEILSLYRSIAEQLPAKKRFVCHGAAISWKGKGYIFLAPSGTGKTTHIRLWQQHLGEGFEIINGDKPILDLSGEGPRLCATPWAGKEGWQNNISRPLCGVCLLRRGETDRIEREKPGNFLANILNQVYRPKDKKAFLDTLSLIDRAFIKTPFFVLHCTPTEEAVKTSFPALTGEPYPKG